jgi:hypothetical protein
VALFKSLLDYWIKGRQSHRSLFRVTRHVSGTSLATKTSAKWYIASACRGMADGRFRRKADIGRLWR